MFLKVWAAIQRFLGKFRFYILGIALFILFVDMFLLESTYSLLVIFGLFLGILTALTFKLHSDVLFGLALFLFMFIPLFLIVEKPEFAEKAAIWAYLLLVFGTISVIFEKR